MQTGRCIHTPAHTCAFLNLSPLSFLDRVLLHSTGWSGIHGPLALASWVPVFLACTTTPGSHLIHSHVISCMFALTLTLSTIPPWFIASLGPCGDSQQREGLLEEPGLVTECTLQGMSPNPLPAATSGLISLPTFQFACLLSLLSHSPNPLPYSPSQHCLSPPH